MRASEDAGIACLTTPLGVERGPVEHDPHIIGVRLDSDHPLTTRTQGNYNRTFDSQSVISDELGSDRGKVEFRQFRETLRGPAADAARLKFDVERCLVYRDPP